MYANGSEAQTNGQSAAWQGAPGGAGAVLSAQAAGQGAAQIDWESFAYAQQVFAQTGQWPQGWSWDRVAEAYAQIQAQAQAQAQAEAAARAQAFGAAGASGAAGAGAGAAHAAGTAAAGNAYGAKVGAAASQNADASTSENREALNAVLDMADKVLPFIPGGKVARVTRTAIPIARMAMQNADAIAPVAKKAVAAGQEAASKVVATAVASAEEAAAKVSEASRADDGGAEDVETEGGGQHGLAFGVGRLAGNFVRKVKSVAKETSSAYKDAVR